MPPPYVLDSSAIIDLHQHFPKRRLRKALNGLARQDRLRIPEGVRREIKRKTDDARKTLEQLDNHSPQFVVRIARVHNLQEELSRIEQAYGEQIRLGNKVYPGFWHSASGRKAVDGQVVALAKKQGGTVVSDDRGIRAACLLENVPCIGWTEFARVLSLGEQRTLF